MKKYRAAYSNQKAGAKRRGIEFLLTFEQWVEWWGTDIDNRGRRPWNLQMQRPMDQGPYALGNIRKGRPVNNSRTNAAMYHGRETDKAKARVQAALDAAMWGPSAESDYSILDDPAQRRIGDSPKTGLATDRRWLRK